MISIEKCYKLLDSGFSLITAGADKKPNMRSWKPYQTTPISKQEFAKAYNSEDTTAKTEIVGILTGFNNLEVIDIDLIFELARIISLHAVERVHVVIELAS